MALLYLQNYGSQMDHQPTFGNGALGRILLWWKQHSVLSRCDWERFRSNCEDSWSFGYRDDVEFSNFTMNSLLGKYDFLTPCAYINSVMGKMRLWVVTGDVCAICTDSWLWTSLTSILNWFNHGAFLCLRPQRIVCMWCMGS